MRDYLIELRSQHNESQQDVADALGITRQYYSLIEKGERQKRMDIVLISAIANHYHIPLAEIIRAENQCGGC